MDLDMDFQRALGLLEGAGKVLVTTHARPDGDACGSMSSLGQVATSALLRL